MKILDRFFAAPLVLFLLAFSVTVAYAQEPVGTAELSLQPKLNQLTTSVYCYCGCNRETIQHCVCGVAGQVETDFRNRLEAGETVEQIRNDYLAKYGTQYSALMPVEGFNIVAYVMPGIILILLGVIAFLVLKSKHRSRLAQQPASTKQPKSASTDSYKKIEAEIERYKQQR